MEDKKILFFDIDGTLLSHKTFKVPESAKLAIKEAKKNGHLVFVNTGRTISVIDREVKEIGFDGYICGCGSYIEADGKVIYSNDIEKDRCNEIIKKIKKTDLNVVLEGRKAIYYNENADISKDIVLGNLRKNNYPVSTYKDKNIEFDKMFIKYNNKNELNKFYDFIKDIFDLIDHGKGTAEMVPKNHSKGSGIDFLLDYYDIKSENTYGFGDSNNDIDMFEKVSNIIVMGNGNPDLFKKATFVTKDIDDNGIEYAMKHFEII